MTKISDLALGVISDDDSIPILDGASTKRVLASDVADYVNGKVTTGVSSVDGDTGAVDLSGSYVALTNGASLQATLDGLGTYTSGDPLRKITVKPGSYTVSSAIEVPSGVSLDLTGVSLTLADGANCDIITNADWTGNTDIEITGGWFDGNRTGQSSTVGDGPGQSLITMVNVDRLTIRGVRGTSPFLHGVDLAVRDYHTNSYSDPGCTNFIVDDIIVSDFGDDGVTTHWSHHGTISNVYGFDNAGSYSANSGAVEIDDGSHDILVSNLRADNCDFALNVKGHPDRGTARRVTAHGVLAEDCQTGVICYADTPYDTDGPLPGPGFGVAVHGLIARGCDAAIKNVHYGTVEFFGPLVDSCTNLFSGEDPTDPDANRNLVFHGGQVVATRTVLDNTNYGRLHFIGTSFDSYSGASLVTVSCPDVTFEDCSIANGVNNTTAALHLSGAQRCKVIGGYVGNTAGAAIRLTDATDSDLIAVTAFGKASAGDIYIPSGGEALSLRVHDANLLGAGLNVVGTTSTGIVKDIRGSVLANGSSGLVVSGTLSPAPTLLNLVTPQHAVWADDPMWSNPGDGNKVSSWRNASGGGDPANANSASQPTFRSEVTALNGHAGVEFSAASTTYLDYDIANNSQAFTVVIVAAVTGTGATQKILGRGTGSGGIGVTSGNAWQAHFGTSLTSGTKDANAHVIKIVVNGASSIIEVDGTVLTTADAGAGAMGRFSLGASSTSGPVYSEHLTGTIAFCGIYAGAAPAGIDTLVDELGAYYGITVA